MFAQNRHLIDAFGLVPLTKLTLPHKRKCEKTVWLNLDLFRDTKNVKRATRNCQIIILN